MNFITKKNAREVDFSGVSKTFRMSFGITYAGILMLESFTDEISDEKIKEESANAMLLEIRNNGLD